MKPAIRCNQDAYIRTWGIFNVTLPRFVGSPDRGYWFTHWQTCLYVLREYFAGGSR